MSPEPPLDATGIASRRFSSARRGLDANEVRAYLAELAETLAEAKEREAVAVERAELAEARAADAQRIDQDRLVELVEEETARMLDAARAAASDIRTTAQEAAARMVQEGQAEAHTLVDRAEDEATTRRGEILAEAETLRAAAENELDRQRAAGEVAAGEIRQAAEAERGALAAAGEQARADAAADAETIVAAAGDDGELIREAARREARHLVAEALAVREKLLGDLARRRHAAREQVERLHAARKRLLAAYTVVRRTADEATGELNIAPAEAKLAGDQAVRRVRGEVEPTVDDLEVELSAARMAGLVDADTGADIDVDVPDLAARLGASAADHLAAATESLPAESLPPEMSDPGGDVGTDEAHPDEEPHEADDDAGTDPTVPAERHHEAAKPGEAAAPGEIGEAMPPEAPAAAADTDSGEAEGAVVVDPSPALDDSGASREDDRTPGGPARPTVDALFARIRADRERREEGDEPPGPTRTRTSGRRRAGTAPPPEPPPAPVDRAPVADADPVGERATPGVAAPGDADLLLARDAALTGVEGVLARRLKRVLADEQNEVLDLLRRETPGELDDLVPGEDEHVDRYAQVARADLELAAGEGAAAVGGPRSSTCASLAVGLGRALVDPLRLRIERSIEETGDLDEATSRLRALYREWKGQRIGETVRHFAVAAYAAGALDAVGTGAAVRWLVDRTGEPCPDADDNALARGVRKGEAFPTGDRGAPAHPGCRCLVVPAVGPDMG